MTDRQPLSIHAGSPLAHTIAIAEAARAWRAAVIALADDSSQFAYDRADLMRDALLAAVDAEEDGRYVAGRYRQCYCPPNPYRPETATREATGAPVTPAAPDALPSTPNPSAAATGPHSPERTTP